MFAPVTAISEKAPSVPVLRSIRKPPSSVELSVQPRRSRVAAACSDQLRVERKRRMVSEVARESLLKGFIPAFPYQPPRASRGAVSILNPILSELLTIPNFIPSAVDQQGSPCCLL